MLVLAACDGAVVGWAVSVALLADDPEPEVGDTLVLLAVLFVEAYEVLAFRSPG